MFLLRLNRYKAMFLAFCFILLWGIIDYLLDVIFPASVSPHITHAILYSILIIINVAWGWSFGSLYERVYNDSLIDPLTSLYNKKYFIDTAKNQLIHSMENGTPLTIAVADIDGFKTYNDTFGHLAGDNILKAVASSFGENIRSQDLVARFGGDEFVFLFPSTDAQEATKTIQRMQGSLNKAVQGKVGISFGIATYPSDGTTIEELLHIADQNMYCCKAKTKSGNKAVRVS